MVSRRGLVTGALASWCVLAPSNAWAPGCWRPNGRCTRARQQRELEEFEAQQARNNAAHQQARPQVGRDALGKFDALEKFDALRKFSPD
jgi:hypothetical protein